MQKGSATLFLLIAGLVIVVIISIFSFGFKKPPALQAPIKSLVAVPSSKIPVYSNQKLGLEFQYPNKDFKVQEDSEEAFNQRGGGDFRKNFKGYVGYEPGKSLGVVVVLDSNNDFNKNPLSIWVFENSNNLTIDKWFDQYWYYPFLWGVFDYASKSHIALDKEASISGQLAKYKVVAYQPGSPKFMYVAKGGKIYLFRVIGETGDKILVTFKFL